MQPHFVMCESKSKYLGSFQFILAIITDLIECTWKVTFRVFADPHLISNGAVKVP